MFVIMENIMKHPVYYSRISHKDLVNPLSKFLDLLLLWHVSSHIYMCR